MKLGFDVGIKEPEGMCCKWSKSKGEGIEWRNKKSEMEVLGSVVLDSIRSLGIKKVMLLKIRLGGAMLRRKMKVK